MKMILVLAIVVTALVGCQKQASSSASPNADATSRAANNSTIEPNASGSTTRLQAAPRTTEPAGPSTGVGSGAATSSGIGTASASGASANESRSAETKNVPPAGTGAQSPTINSNGVGNAGSSSPQNSGLAR